MRLRSLIHGTLVLGALSVLVIPAFIVKADSSDPWFDHDWVYRRALTISHTKVSGTSALTNFPVLVSVQNNDLKSVANGGKVAQNDGGDIVFVATNDVTKL